MPHLPCLKRVFTRFRFPVGSSIHQALPTLQANWVTSEESKVKLWHRVSLVSNLKKGGANRIAYFLHSIFKEQAPLSPANARCFAGSGVSSARVGPWQPEPAPPSLLCLSQLSLLHLLHERQIESSPGQHDLRPHTHCR